MEVKTGIVVVIEEMIPVGHGKGGQHRNLRFGLVQGSTPPENNPNRYNLFEVCTAGGRVEPIKREEMFPVAQLPERIEKRDESISVGCLCLEDALIIAMPEILLTLIGSVHDLAESLERHKLYTRKTK